MSIFGSSEQLLLIVWFSVIHDTSFGNPFYTPNQFAPVDTPAAVETFLGYWKPNAILLIESELWPNLIMSAARNGVRDLF